MTVYFSYPGKTFVAPDHVVFGFLSISQGEAKYRYDNEVTVRIDSESFNLGRLKVADRSIDSNMSVGDVTFWRETLELPVTTQEFLRIANGRNVKMKLGKTEIDLAGNHRKLLRALAGKIGN